MVSALPALRRELTLSLLPAGYGRDEICKVIRVFASRRLWFPCRLRKTLTRTKQEHIRKASREGQAEPCMFATLKGRLRDAAEERSAACDVARGVGRPSAHARLFAERLLGHIRQYGDKPSFEDRTILPAGDRQGPRIGRRVAPGRA